MKAFGKGFALLAVAGALCATSAPVQAQANTGEFSAGSLDLFWSWTSGQVATPTTGSAAWVIDPANQHPNWVAPPPNSRWITALQGWEYDAPDDLWTTYFMDFTVANPAGYSLTGRWASDNNSSLWLNGVQMGSVGITSFTALTPFTLNSGFVAGSNTLAVQVLNLRGSNNPSGVIVSDLDASVVPEPASLVLLFTGLAGMGLVARRRRQQEMDS